MNLSRIQIKDISEQIDPYAIKNFIVSDESVRMPHLTANHPFVTDGIIFAICISGNGRIKINFKEYEIGKNTIMTFLPHYVIEIIEQSENAMNEFLIFSPDFLTEIPSSGNLDISMSLIESPCLKVSDEEAEKLLEFHSFIVKQHKRREHPFREQMAKSLLIALLSEIGAIYYTRMNELKKEQFSESEINTYQKEQMYTFFRLVLANHKKEKSLKFYADKMFLTPKYLSTIIKERTGRTAFSWINEALISSTKHMLKTTDLTILQISEELNFPNPSFFGRFFKKHTGMTPVQYRES
ncbi:AraC family transcriptional regulator [Dysgonomonas sp. Marseille-P4677]|uniref:AraC family transcriptional regulator n=1 Tax=Dysgonomonas sp. Marseille-P4677 TaxID=2364790 RepID=UPI001913E61D|nr:helix-turn-helix transcriptional regulator [Dysgonomonas sp. Marseille-P4677]MBK5721255.1 AraC family transcriptional regulator [Dysgonomonas sp. Marseille-P4677]